MAKRRTRKNKENTHHHFLYSWSKNESSEARVNRDLNSDLETRSKKLTKKERADFMAKETLSASTKSGVLKSLFLASLILVAELVIYLGWNGFIN